MTAADLAWAFDRLTFHDLPRDQQDGWQRVAEAVETYVSEDGVDEVHDGCEPEGAADTARAEFEQFRDDVVSRLRDFTEEITELSVAAFTAGLGS